jgi:NADH-quinone oxidoreductase subunit E
MAEERMEEVGDEGALRAARVPPGWDEAARLEEDPATIPDPAEVEIPDDLRREIEAHMAKYPDRHSAALPALGAAQQRHGWCSPEALLQVAAVMQVTPAYLSSLATFYDMLRTEPTGRRYLYVCTSVACHVRNSKAIYDAIWEEARDQQLEDVELREFECLGACDMAPMASVDGRYVGPLDDSDAPELVSAMKEGRPVLPGRGLEDSDYRLPWDMETQPAQSAGSEARADDQRSGGLEDAGGAPAYPDVDPAGGTVKDPEEVPPGGSDEGVEPPPQGAEREPDSMRGGRERRDDEEDGE